MSDNRPADSPADRWYRLAKEDLAAAQAMLHAEDVAPRIACFLAQQAAEKALKIADALLTKDSLALPVGTVQFSHPSSSARYPEWDEVASLSPTAPPSSTRPQGKLDNHRPARVPEWRPDTAPWHPKIMPIEYARG